MKENVEHHVKEEKTEMFPKAWQPINTTEAEISGKDMQKTKKEFQAQK